MADIKATDFNDDVNDDDSSSEFYSEKESLNSEKLDSRRKLEDLLDRKRLEKDWYDY